MSKPGPQSAGGQAGVTLIELVAALVVLALTFAIAGAGLRFLARSSDRGTELIGRHDMLSRGLDALRRDIEGLQRVVWKRGRNNEFAFSGDGKRLVFVAIEPPYPTQAAPFFLIYSIVQRSDWGTLVRARVPFDAGAKDIDGLRGEDEVSVLEGPFTLGFSYYERKEGRERWVPRWTERDRVPELIRLEIVSLGAGGSLQPIVLRPRIDAEQDCIKEGAGACTMKSGGVLVPEPAAAPERRN
jgi:prepilin-type N-terminal cleavage/methylation domain-containing protein